MSDQYKSVMRIVDAEKDWPLRTWLEAFPPKEWLGRLVEIFKACCTGQNDKEAKWYFGLIMQIIEDDLLSPYIKKVKGGEILEGDWIEIRKARNKAKSARAEWAKELWRGLPTKQQMLAYVQHDMGDHRLESIDAAALLETREAILSEIAQCWRVTESEVEADQLFAFLVEETASAFEEERKVVIAVFRKVTDMTFPVTRLTRNLLWYLEKRKQVKGLTSILAIARTRNSENVREEVSVLRPLEGCSDEAYRFAARLMADVAVLDDKGLDLGWTIQPENERLCRSERMVYGEVTVTYQDLNTVAVKIVQTFDHPDSLLESWGPNQIELARFRAAAWKGFNPDIRIQLSLIMKKRSSQEIVFAEEREL